jgi:spore coat polysaccharide biosynthesis protein SpsF
MGGSDPAGLTLKAVRALELVNAPFRAIVVVGRAFCFRDELEALLATAKHACEVREDVSDMAGLMAEADLAVASFCVTAYELAAMGVPGIYLCLTDDHAESASAFVGAGIGISLGVHGAVSVEQVSDRIRSLLADPAERTRMSERCRRLIDGRGAERIARICVDRVAKVADYAWRQ